MVAVKDIPNTNGEKDQSGLGAVITQYYPVEHIKFFNYSLNDVSEKWHLTSMNDCNKRYNESALIFVHYLNAIIYIRHTLSDNICAIEGELKTCKRRPIITFVCKQRICFEW